MLIIPRGPLGVFLNSTKVQHQIENFSKSADFNELVTVLLNTNMLVSGVIGCFFDNVLPGSAEDRGIFKWREPDESDLESNDENLESIVYGKPISKGSRFWKYVPFCPNFRSKTATVQPVSPPHPSTEANDSVSAEL